MIMMPATLIGTTIGMLVNQMLPEIMTLIGLALTLIGIAFLTLY